VRLVAALGRGSKVSYHPKQQREEEMNVNVGTNNSLKVRAVRAAFAAAFPEDDVEVNAIDVPSGVPNQRSVLIQRLLLIAPVIGVILDIAVMNS